MRKILVTGGVGFIGSFLVDRLVKEGYEVVVLDNLEKQVHQKGIPSYLNKEAEFVNGSVSDYDLLKKVIVKGGVEVVYHQAALVGVGQSMYQVRRYSDINVMGTACLLDILANESHNVRKVIVAGSMSSYGEGSYECKKCGTEFWPSLRTEKQLSRGKWEHSCQNCSEILTPVPTPESKPFSCESIYGITKSNQEQTTLAICRSYGIPAVALRYFNVYGPRQSLSNPYTGVASIFASRLKKGKGPLIFEDGLQTRDFVSVHDVVQANILALKSGNRWESFNVGSGRPLSIKEVAETIQKLFFKEKQNLDLTGEYRKGDVRHCYADITKIKSKLGYSPKIEYEEGMKHFIEWSEGQDADDRSEQAVQKLREKNLLK